MLALASRWHGSLFSVDLWGSVECLWEFLRLASVVEEVSEHEPARGFAAGDRGRFVTTRPQ